MTPAVPTDPSPAPTRRALAVGLVGLLIAAVMVVGVVEGADPSIGEGRTPFVTIYEGPRDQIEAVLVSGDGQAFAAIAQDPLLSRPHLVPGHGEFAYRAQRPLWGYAAWVLSAGQPGAVGWALAVMTAAAAGACVTALALLLLQRGQSPWWALAALGAGLESLSQLTPELLALALVAVALWLPREHRGWAMVACCAAVLTRETMLVAIAAWAVFELVHSTGDLRTRIRSAAPFAWPFAVFGTWVLVLRLRVGTWIWDQTHERSTAPLTGLRDAFDPVSGRITLLVTIAATVCVIAVALARRDVLTWIALGFAALSTTFASQVWTGAGYERTLLPLYALGGIAALTGLRRRVERHSSEASAGPMTYTDAPSLTTSGR